MEDEKEKPSLHEEMLLAKLKRKEILLSIGCVEVDPDHFRSKGGWYGTIDYLWRIYKNYKLGGDKQLSKF